MKEISQYRQQQKLSFIQFLGKLPVFIVMIISAIATKSLIVWIDVIDSFSIVLRAGCLALLSRQLTKDLRYEYNYGIAKVEAIAALFCDALMMGGLFLVTGSAVKDLMHPERPSGLLIYVVAIKVVNVISNTIFLAKQRQILMLNKGMMVQSSYEAAVGMFLFECAELVSMLLIWFFRKSAIGLYLAPLLALVIVGYQSYRCVFRLKRAVDQLTDRTISEESQLQVLKVLTRYYERYSEFHSVKSHQVGEKIQIDLELSFEPGTTVDEITELTNALQKEMTELLGDCVVNIIL